MKNYTPLLIIGLMIVSCSNKTKHSNDGYSEIAGIIDGVEVTYTSQSLSDLSNVSQMAGDYKKQLSTLEKKANVLKALFVQKQSIPTNLQSDFINAFEKSLKYVSNRDSTSLDLLRKTPIRSLNDIDRLSLFMKRSYLNQVFDSERYLFNTVSTVGVAENSNIKKGDSIIFNLNLTAANTDQPAEWFILRDGGESLLKDNISDTLYPDKFGEVKFTRKATQAGDNSIVYATKLQSTRGEVVLYKTIYFKVQ